MHTTKTLTTKRRGSNATLKNIREDGENEWSLLFLLFANSPGIKNWLEQLL